MTQIDMPIEGPSVWTRCDIRTEDYRVDLSAACLDEIRQAADEIGDYPLPPILRTPGDFAMPACRREMARVREMLDHGRRFAIIDRLPMTEMDTTDATAIYWLLSSMVSRPVAQKLDGADPSRPRVPPRCGGHGPRRYRRVRRRYRRSLGHYLCVTSNNKIAIMMGFHVSQGGADGRRG